MQELIAPKRGYSRAFALPTILIASTVMLIVLLSAVQATVSTNNAINNQYLDKIGKEAAESGIAMAKACVAANSGSITWSNTTPLKPNTNCSGADQTSGACTDTSVDARCYILNSTNYRSSFTVGVIMSGSTPTDFDAKGIVSNVRTKSLGVASQSTYNIKLTVPAGTGSLHPVGTMQGIVAIDEGYGSPDSQSPLCGLTTTGEVWCSGYAPGGGVDSYYNKTADSGTAYSASVAYMGGKVYCSDSPAFDSTASCSTAKYFLSNLSDPVEGIFKNANYMKLMAYTYTQTDSGVKRPDALCAISTGTQVFCAGIDISGTDSLSYAGGARTIDGRRYRTNLSDATNGVFRGKTATSITMFERFRYTSEGNGYYPAPSICITTNTGTVSCAGYATSTYNMFGGTEDPFVNSVLPYRLGPVTCSVNPSMLPTRACANSVSVGPIFYVSDVTNGATGIFKGKFIIGLVDYDMFINGYYSNSAIPHAMCGITSAHEVYCASVNQSNSNFSQTYPNRLGYNSGSVVCGTTTSLSPTSSCSSSSSIYYLSNLSHSNGGVFFGRDVTKLISAPTYGNYAWPTASMCALLTNSKLICTGAVHAAINHTMDSMYGGDPAYVLGDTNCGGGSCSNAGSSWDGSWSSDLTGNTYGIFNGKTIVDLTRSSSTNPYSICVVTSVGEVLCGVHENSVSYDSSAVANALTYSGGTRTQPNNNAHYLTNLSASPGGVFSITNAAGGYSTTGTMYQY